MDKNAQKRNPFNKYLKEMTDFSGIAMEKLFDSEFKKVMDNIREKDSQIRAIAIGKPYEKADPGPDPISLKDLLKSAKSSFGKREYMAAIDQLGRFHNKLMKIVSIAKSVNAIDQDEQDKKMHREFLLRNLDDEQRSRLSNLGERFASAEDQLITEAGLEDFFASLPGARGRSLAAYEKRFPEQVKQLKSDTQALINASEKIFSRLISSLKEMDSARSTRNPTNYRKAVAKFAGDFVPYHEAFENFYKSHMKDFKDLLSKKPEVQKAPAAPIQHSTQFGDSEVASGFKPAIVGTPGTSDPNAQRGIELETLPPTDNAKTDPSPPPDMSVDQLYQKIQTPEAITALRPPRTPTLLGVAPPAGGGVAGGPPAGGPLQPPQAHSKFYEELQSLSNEHPLILAGYIKKYAVSIQDSDPETSIQLFKIVRSIKE